MSPLICTLYQRLGICNTIHIAHLCMAVKFYTFLWAGVYSGCSKIGNFLDSCNRCDRKFTVKSVYRCYASELQECTFLYMFCHFRHLLISQEHFYYNTVCKICDWEDQDGLFVADFSCFYIHNLTADDNFTHLTGNRFQSNRFAFEISSIDNIRIAVPSESASEIALLVLAVAQSRLFVFLILLCFIGFLFRFFLTICLILVLRNLSTFGMDLRMAHNIFYFLCNLKLSILMVFTLLHFHILKFHFQVHSTSFAENFLQIFDQNLTLLSGNHGIRKNHMKIMFSRKSDLRLLKCIVFQHVIVA